MEELKQYIVTTRQPMTLVFTRKKKVQVRYGQTLMLTEAEADLFKTYLELHPSEKEKSGDPRMEPKEEPKSEEPETIKIPFLKDADEKLEVEALEVHHDEQGEELKEAAIEELKAEEPKSEEDEKKKVKKEKKKTKSKRKSTKKK